MSTEHPVVSVIIPAYKCVETLPLAIDSALRQRVPLEILVINDCSPEDLAPVMSRYQSNPAVRYLCNEKNMGAAASRNRGMALAQGKYIAFLDADDYWTDDKLERQVAVLEQSDAVLSATGRELMTPEGVLTGRVIPVQERITYRDLLRHNCINCSSVLIKADVARRYPMHHEDSHEDYIMWLEVLRENGTARGISEPMLKYRLSNTGKSGSKWNSAKMTFKAYRYMGFGLIKSCCCFVSYAWNGIKKYYLDQ